MVINFPRERCIIYIYTYNPTNVTIPHMAHMTHVASRKRLQVPQPVGPLWNGPWRAETINGLRKKRWLMFMNKLNYLSFEPTECSVQKINAGHHLLIGSPSRSQDWEKNTYIGNQKFTNCRAPMGTSLLGGSKDNNLIQLPDLQGHRSSGSCPQKVMNCYTRSGGCYSGVCLFKRESKSIPCCSYTMFEDNSKLRASQLLPN